MIRLARPDELPAILDWAAAEGWNPGLDDAAAFRAADPAGFFVALRDHRPVAAISVVNHSDDFAFLGLYLCLPAWRGQGIGYALWAHALGHAARRTVGLDGVAAQQANYAKSGFVHAGATRRFEGPLTPAPAADVRPATPSDHDALTRLDRAANGVDRPRFVSAWIAAAVSRRTLVLDTGHGPEGFATIRRCRTGAKIGPLIAPDASTGLRLARAALAALPAETTIIDIPQASVAMSEALGARGLRETFATARMYRGIPPPTGATLQGIATMELG